jgi:hypothetical protein
VSLSTPQQVQARLEEIENLIAETQNELEGAALDWFRRKAEREQAWTREYIAASGPAHVRKATADLRASTIGIEEEARWEAMKVKMRGLSDRGNIGMAILKSQGRA